MTDPAPADLEQAAVRGVRWMTLLRLATEVIVLGSSVVLARMISPAEFGLAVVIRLLPILAVILTFEGFGTRLVQRADTEVRLLRTARTLGWVAGVALTGVTLAIALAVSPWIGSERAELLAMAAPSFLLVAPSVVPRAIVQRRLDFRRLSLAETGGWLAFAAVAIALAVAGLGAPAIVLGTVAAALTETVVVSWRIAHPRPGYDADAARELLRFGVPAALAGLSAVVYRNIDYLALSLRASPTAVGYYWRGFQVGAEYQGRVGSLVMRLAFPLAARTGDLERMARFRVRGLRLITLVCFPPLALFAVVAPVLVPLVYGPEWTGAVVPAQILVVAGLALSVVAMLDPVVIAAGHPRRLLVQRLVMIALLAGVVLATASAGLTTVCIAVSALQVAGTVAAERLVLNPVVPAPGADVLRALLPGTGCAAVVAAGGFPLAAWLERAGAGDAAVLAAVIGWALAAGGLTLRVGFPASWREATGLLGQVLGRRRPAAPVAAEAAGSAA